MSDNKSWLDYEGLDYYTKKIKASLDLAGIEINFKIEVPYTLSQLTYTGQSQTPIWEHYNSDRIIRSGTISGIDADTYETTFTPKTGYTWTDGSTDPKTISWSISRQQIPIPYISAPLTYNGYEQSPTVINYDPNIMSVEGTQSAVNASTYTLYYTPDSNHCWPDNTYNTQTLTWTINKAPLFYILSAASCSVNNVDTGYAAITVDKPSDGQIVATSDNQAVATVAVYDNVIYIYSGPSTGATYVQVHITEGTNYLAGELNSIYVSNSVYVDVPHTQVITSTSNFINETGKQTDFVVRLFGGGSGYTGGGGGGHMAVGTFSLYPGEQVQIIIGEGGTGNGTGGTTSFGAYLSANGGYRKDGGSGGGGTDLSTSAESGGIGSYGGGGGGSGGRGGYDNTAKLHFNGIAGGNGGNGGIYGGGGGGGGGGGSGGGPLSYTKNTYGGTPGYGGAKGAYGGNGGGGGSQSSVVLSFTGDGADVVSMVVSSNATNGEPGINTSNIANIDFNGTGTAGLGGVAIPGSYYATSGAPGGGGGGGYGGVGGSGNSGGEPSGYNNHPAGGGGGGGGGGGYGANGGNGYVGLSANNINSAGSGGPGGGGGGYGGIGGDANNICGGGGGGYGPNNYGRGYGPWGNAYPGVCVVSWMVKQIV